MDLLDTLAIYRLMSVKGVGRATVNKILHRISSRELSARELFLREICEMFGNGILSADQIDEFLAPDQRLDEQLDQCSKDDWTFISILDERYPVGLVDLLGDGAPPIISFKGNRDLLAESSVGFCGSRKASTKGMETACDCASQLAGAHAVIVSGNAAGIDVTAHQAALEVGGRTIIVLPEGVLRFRVRKELRENWNWENVLVISEFAPGISWNAHQAMQRNKTIIGLSDIMIVIEAGEKGGTMDAGQSTLKFGRPLYAPVYDGMPDSAAGNRYLLQRGAKPLRKHRDTNRANLRLLVDELETISKNGRNSRDQNELRFA